MKELLGIFHLTYFCCGIFLKQDLDKTFSYNCMIVGYEYADHIMQVFSGFPIYYLLAGITTNTVVPLPGMLLILYSPSIIEVRSFIPKIPKVLLLSIFLLSKPLPSSSIHRIIF